MDTTVFPVPGPCGEAYEYDLSDSDMLGPVYSAEEVNPKVPLAVESEEQTNG